MKKIIFITLSYLLFTSCNQISTQGDKTLTQGDDTVAEINISTSKTGGLIDLVEEVEQAENKLIFKASGVEPGWYAEIYNHKIKVIVDYGKDSLILDEEVRNLESDNGFLCQGEINTHTKKSSYSIDIENKPCKDVASGSKKDRTVTVKLNGKTYKGCGSFIR